MCGGHGRPDVLRLSGGRLGGRPRAHVRVPRGVRHRALVVLGAASEDFGPGGRGEEFEHRRVQYEVAAVGHL